MGAGWQDDEKIIKIVPHVNSHSFKKLPSFYPLPTVYSSSSRIFLFKTEMKEWWGRITGPLLQLFPLLRYLRMACPFRSLPLDHGCQSPLLLSKSFSSPLLWLTFFICLFGYFLLATLFCKLHEGKSLSYFLLFFPVPRTEPKEVSSQYWMNQSIIYKSWKRKI